MLQSSSANGRIRPPDGRVMRLALVGSPQACARLRNEIDGAIAVVGTFPDLASARASAVQVDAFLVANEGNAAGPDDLRSLDRSYIDSSEVDSSDVDPSDIERAYLEPSYVEPLTEREVQVLELLAEGLSNKGIGARLGISDQTVKFHVASISGKLGTHTRTETVRRAVRSGLISL